MVRATETPKTGTESGTFSGAVGIGVAMNPALQTLAIMAAVSLTTWTAHQAGNVDPFVLQAPIDEKWWQLPLSVYAHASPTHFAGNAMVVLIAGGLVSLSAGWLRFHVFFLASGMLAGASQVLATGALGEASAVVGASGAALALIGYFLTSNAISTTVLRRVPLPVVVPVVTGIALLLTIQSAGLEIANVTHFVGAVLGLLAGHFNILRPRFSLSLRRILDAVGR